MIRIKGMALALTMRHFGFHVEASWNQMSDATLVRKLMHDGDQPSLNTANQ
jgi:hypothetical protein